MVKCAEKILLKLPEQLLQAPSKPPEPMFSVSKHGCLRPRKKVLSLEVSIKTLVDMYVLKCFNFHSLAPEFASPGYSDLVFCNKTCRFLKA